MSDTPRTDALAAQSCGRDIQVTPDYYTMLGLARMLERELALANARIDYLMSPDSSHPEVTATSTAGQPATEHVLIGPRWIDTKVRVPGDGDDVLGYWCARGPGGKADCDVVHYYRGRWHEPDDGDDDFRAPEFWMPIPKAPDSPMNVSPEPKKESE